jgi:hypothetical protein
MNASIADMVRLELIKAESGSRIQGTAKMGDVRKQRGGDGP